MALLLANVALSDTFDTWRIRTNQIIEEAVSSTSTTSQTFAANTTFNGIVNVSNTFVSTANADFSGYVKFTSSGQIKLPVGNTAQRIENTIGGFRYNNELDQFEGYSSDGWGQIGGGGLGFFKLVSAAYTANTLDRLAVDTTSSNVTVTLPATPSQDDIIEFLDKEGNFSSNYLIINRNGSSIEGVNDDLIADVSGANFYMQYDGTTWQVFGPSDGTQTLTGVVQGPYGATTFANPMIVPSVFTAPAGGAVNLNGTTTANTLNVTTTLTVSGDMTLDTVTANTLTGTISTAAQPNITSVGTLNVLAVNGDITADTVTANTLTGTVSTAAQPNITSVGTLTALTSSGTVSGALLTSNTVFANNYTEKAIVQNVTGATTIDLTTGQTFVHTLDGNVTYTFSNPPTTGTSSGFTVKVVQDSNANGYTITWPGSVKWVAQTAPTLTATASAVDVVVFFTHDAGANYYGFVAGQDLL